MAKRREIDGKYYRMRRGRLVRIPDEWLGKTLHHQTKRKRKSKFNFRNPRRKGKHEIRGGRRRKGGCKL